MSTERVDPQSVYSQSESPTRQSLLAKIRNLPNDVRRRTQDLASGIAGDIRDGRVQRELNPFLPTLPPQEQPNSSEPGKS